MIAVLLKAETIIPKLNYEKMLQFDGSVLTAFQKWSIGDSKKDVKTLCLSNKFNTNLIFQIQVEGPFKLIKTATNSPLKYNLFATKNPLDLTKKCETGFNLVHDSNSEITVVFNIYIYIYF